MARDYKAEYQKYHSSDAAKQYRADLNRYNSKNPKSVKGDGKDASHKGGKIAGLETASKNKGRLEKSRLPGKKHRTKAIVKSLTA